MRVSHDDLRRTIEQQKWRLRMIQGAIGENNPEYALECAKKAYRELDNDKYRMGIQDKETGG